MLRAALLLTLTFLGSQSILAFNNAVSDCNVAYHLALRLCAANDSSCMSVAQDCSSKCAQALPTASSLHERNYIQDQVRRCQGFAPDPALACAAAHQNLVSCSRGCEPQKNECLSQCPLAQDRERCELVYTSNERNQPAGPPRAEDPADPVEPVPSDEQDPPAPTTADLDPAVTGTPNPLIPMTSGDSGFGSNYSEATGGGGEAVGSGSNINFTPNIGGPLRANSPPISAGGYAGTGSGTDSEFAGEMVGSGLPNTNGGGTSAGGGRGGGGGAAGMPMMGGGGGAPANGGTASNRRQGGGSRNGAAEYLNKLNPFAFQSPPGGTNAGGASKTTRAVATRRGNPPKYNKKENDGREALSRLFGNGTAPSSYRRNPYGAGSGKKCLDSVFCPVEVFYNKIERLPNHEINPDSY